MKNIVDTIWLGNCMEIMPKLPINSVDLILCDLPYNQTACDWDQQPIDLYSLWKEYKKLLKPGGTTILTASGKFASLVSYSNLDWLKYDIVWVKAQATNPMNIKTRPGKIHENIFVFCEGTPYYNPQMLEGKPYAEFVDTKGKTIGEAHGSAKSIHRANVGTRYPNSVVYYPRERTGPKHPTKKPLELFKYLVQTFSKSGDLILDNTCGIGTTGKAAQETGRHYVLIEQNKDYYKQAKEWLKQK